MKKLQKDTDDDSLQENFHMKKEKVKDMIEKISHINYDFYNKIQDSLFMIEQQISQVKCSDVIAYPWFIRHEKSNVQDKTNLQLIITMPYFQRIIKSCDENIFALTGNILLRPTPDLSKQS